MAGKVSERGRVTNPDKSHTNFVLQATKEMKWLLDAQRKIRRPDYEGIHEEADSIILDLLYNLNHNELAEAYEHIEKGYIR